MKRKSLRLGLIVALPVLALLLGVLALRSGQLALADEPVLSIAAAWPPLHTNLSQAVDRQSRLTGFDSNGQDIVAVWSEQAGSSTSYNGRIRMAWNSQAKGEWDIRDVFNAGGFLGLRPSVAVEGSYAYFVWVSKVESAPEYRVMYSTMNLATGDLSSPEQVYPTGTSSSSAPLGDARIAVDSGGVPHVVWVQTGDVGGEERDRIYYSNRSAGSWLAAERISGTNPPSGIDSSATSQDMPTIEAAGTEVYVAWRDKAAGDTSWGIYVRHRIPASGFWEPGGAPVGYRLSDEKYAEFPAMAAAGSRLYVIWDQYMGPDCNPSEENCYQVYSMTYRVFVGTDIASDSDWRPTDGSRDINDGSDPILASASITTPLNPQTGQPSLLPPGDVPSPEGYLSGARPAIQVVEAGGVYTPYVVWHHWANEGHASDSVNPAQPYQVRGAYGDGAAGAETWEYLSEEPNGQVRALHAEGIFASPFLALTQGALVDPYDVHIVMNVRLGDAPPTWDAMYTNFYQFYWSYLPYAFRTY